MDILLYIHAVILVVEIIAIIAGIILWIKGILPVLLRLGYGLSRRKIAVFAKIENARSLKHLLIDSKLFSRANIFEITHVGDLGQAEKASVYLVHWHDWEAYIDQILSKIPDDCALIVYAPSNLSRIPDEQMHKLDGKRHTAVTNFRGRLLNDIVASMITTSYEHR